MVEPPGAVAQSFRPAGELQLHRLGERARFRCVRCGLDKAANFVANVGGDWAQVVCDECYRALAGRPGQAPEIAAGAAPALAARHQLSRSGREPRPEKRKKPPRSVAEKRRRHFEQLAEMERERREKLQRQLPGISQLFAFFRAARIDVRPGRGGSLLVNGKPTAPLARMVPSPRTVDWDSVIDELALKFAGDRFIKAVSDNARLGEGLRAYLRPREKGFAVLHDGVRLAMIRATSASIPQDEVIRANFLTPGPHWQQLARAIRRAEPELMAEWYRKLEARAAAQAADAATETERQRAASWRRIDQLPDDLPPGLASACLEASRRIRLDRQVAYDRPVVLESDFGDLTLLPVTGPESRLLVPFRLSRGTEAITGELVLGDSDPLPLLIGARVAEQDAITAWTCALLGFADATCIELDHGAADQPRPPYSPRSEMRARSSRHHAAARVLPRRQPWPRHLEPIGQWARHSGSFVGGHRRHLHDGQTASAEALDRARQVGIALRPHETWVRPHARGVPDGIEMRFRWHSPNPLTLPPT